jgi:hypothetical protein
LLVELLCSGSDDSKEGAARALGYFTSNGARVFDAASIATIIAAGALTPLVDLLQDGGSAEGRKYAAKVLYNLTTHAAGRRHVEELGYIQDQLDTLS